MDLRAEAQRLALDAAAVQVCRVLADAGVPHVLLKGPSTARWLYDPPRSYGDVDVLVRLDAVNDAVRVLEASGTAVRAGSAAGEEAPHSLMMRERSGCELDLHLTLPTVPASDAVWAALAGHVQELDLDVGTVPVLDLPGRCLVIALHALGSGPGSPRPLEDLALARRHATALDWAAAAELASAMGAADLLAGALAMADGRRDLPPRARLYASAAPSAALALAELARARRRDLPRLVWRELFPTTAFMRHDTRIDDLAGSRLALAHIRRWWRIARQLPRACRALRESHAR